MHRLVLVLSCCWYCDVNASFGILLLIKKIQNDLKIVLFYHVLQKIFAYVTKVNTIVSGTLRDFSDPGQEPPVSCKRSDWKSALFFMRICNVLPSLRSLNFF